MEDGTLQMWYEGVSNTNQHAIGIATSKDGYIWKKINDGKPIFQSHSHSHSHSYIHSNSSSDTTGTTTTTTTTGSEWDSGGVGSPHLVWLPQQRKWRMYYIGNSLNTDLSSIGVAESTDDLGHHFVRISSIH